MSNSINSQKDLIINLKDITFGYTKEDILLNGINMEVRTGDYIGIIGPNGSAKSTLLKLVLGILKPIKGKINLFGEDISSFSDWNKIGYVSQKANSFNREFPITVEEIIQMQVVSGFRPFQKKTKEVTERIDNALEIVGMKDFKKRLIGNLSGGQQQRIFIARALVHNPQMLLMDEPTVGVDSEFEQGFYELLERLNKANISILIVSHDVGAICDSASKIACIDNKKLHIHDTKDSLTREHLKSIYGYDILGSINR